MLSSTNSKNKVQVSFIRFLHVDADDRAFPLAKRISLLACIDKMQEVGLYYLMYNMRFTYMNSISVTEQVDAIKSRPNPTYTGMLSLQLMDFVSGSGVFHSCLLRLTISCSCTVAHIGRILSIPHRKEEQFESHKFPLSENPDKIDHRRVQAVSSLARARASTTDFSWEHRRSATQ
jgi:hypothetical protein